MRKKVICLVLVMMLMLGIMGSTALASGHRPKSVISTNVVFDIYRIINVQYERVISSNMSLYAVPYLGLGFGVTTMGIQAGGKYYLQGTAPEGLWIGGFGMVTYASIPGASIASFAVAGNAGYKLFLSSILTVEANVGYGYAFGSGGSLTWGANIGLGL